MKPLHYANNDKKKKRCQPDFILAQLVLLSVYSWISFENLEN